MQTNFAQCQIGLSFEYGQIDGRHMNLSVQYGQYIYTVLPTFDNEVGSAELMFDIELPAVINFSINNKGPNDTIVDSEGKIIKDCYIKIIGLSIDGFQIKLGSIDQNILVLTENGQSFTTHYLGFNGKAELSLSKPDVMSQVLFLNKF